MIDRIKYEPDKVGSFFDIQTSAARPHACGHRRF